MKILMHGYAPNTPAGMGIVGEELMRRLSAYGHDIVWVAPNGVDQEWNGCDIIPTPQVGETGMLDILQRTLHQEQPDVYFSNLNYHAMGGQIQGVLNNYYTGTGNELPVVLHMPVESEDAPPGFYRRVIEEHLNPVHFLPMTEPTYEVFSDENWCNDYIPHGVQDVYRSMPHREGALKQEFAMRDETVDEDTKIVFTNAGNERRKNLDSWIATAATIKEEYDGDVRFAMHSSPQPKRGDPLWGGWELPRIADAEGLDRGKDILWTKDYPMESVPAERLDHMYGDADVYLSLSGGEGFGMPIAEAGARGTPLVLTDHMNHRWVAGDGAEYVAFDGTTRYRTGEKVYTPSDDDIQAVADTVTSILEDGDKRQTMSENATQAVSDLTWERAAAKLMDYLAEEVN